MKYGIIIQNGIVTLGMPLGSYVFRLDRVKSARMVMNNNMNAENIFVELCDEAEWISQQKGWSAFWAKFSRRFFKSGVIISSYILKVNPHELVNVLNGIAGEQDSTIDQ